MTPTRRYDPSPDRARAIREAREWAHMSQIHLARALGYKSATPVRKWEAAMLDPGPAVAERIAAVTRTSAAALLVPSRREAGPRDARSCGWPATREAA